MSKKKRSKTMRKGGFFKKGWMPGWMPRPQNPTQPQNPVINTAPKPPTSTTTTTTTTSVTTPKKKGPYPKKPGDKGV